MEEIVSSAFAFGGSEIAEGVGDLLEFGVDLLLWFEETAKKLLFLVSARGENEFSVPSLAILRDLSKVLNSFFRMGRVEGLAGSVTQVAISQFFCRDLQVHQQKIFDVRRI